MNNIIRNESIQTEVDRILCIALDVGEGMLKNGDNVHHVEDTIKRICMAYGGAHVETFAISSMILASLRLPDGSYSAQLRRVYSTTNDMSLLEAYNRLSRSICSDTPDFDAAQKMLRDVKSQKKYPTWLVLLGYVLASGAFTVFFGGTHLDGLAGCAVGFVIWYLSDMTLGSINALIKTLFISFISGLLSYLFVIIGIANNADTVMIGGIMMLIPGLAIGNALKDLLCGDFLTGVIKTVQCCLIAVMIAAGFSGAILIMNNFDLSPTPAPVEHGFVVCLLVAVLGTVAFATVFRLRTNLLWLTAIGGCAVYSIYCLCDILGAPLLVSALCASAFCAAFSEVCARVFKAPAIVFLTPTLISIVPGSTLYYTMYALISGDKALLLEKLAATLYIGTGLAAGVIIVTMIVTVIRSEKEKAKLRKK